jgi:hypothetical protein
MVTMKTAVINNVVFETCMVAPSSLRQAADAARLASLLKRTLQM